MGNGVAERDTGEVQDVPLVSGRADVRTQGGVSVQEGGDHWPRASQSNLKALYSTSVTNFCALYPFSELMAG